MKTDEIKIPKKTVLGLTLGILVLATGLLTLQLIRSQAGQPDSGTTYGADLEAGSPEKFALLSGQGGARSVGST